MVPRFIKSVYTGRTGGSASRKGLNNILLKIVQGVLCGHADGNDVGRRVEGPEFDSGQNLFLFDYFLFFFFFPLSFLFSYCSFVLFLYTA